MFPSTMKTRYAVSLLTTIPLVAAVPAAPAAGPPGMAFPLPHLLAFR